MTMQLLLRIRSYPHSHPAPRFVSVWLVEVNGPARSGILHGELLPATAEALAQALGLPVEREASPLAGVTALPPAPEACPGCEGTGKRGEDALTPGREGDPCLHCLGTGVAAAQRPSPPAAEGDLFSDQPDPPRRPEPEPADKVRAPRKRRGKGGQS